MHKVVRIKDDDSIILLFHLEKALKHPLHGEPLALLRRMRPLTDNASVAARDFCRIVAAVVSNDEDIVERRGVFQRLQVLQQLPYDSTFVVRSNNDGEGLFRGQNLVFFPAPHAAKADEEIIQGEQ